MTPSREQLQHSLGRAYTLDRELGGGGMSRVFLADETALGRRVVVKMPALEALSTSSLDRFKREIALAARLHHPHIVPLLSTGEIDGMPYYTMPFVEGETLRARLATTTEFTLPDVIRILRHIASALAFAHAKGIVHRDIKPENILLTREHALVADFGVAKALSLATQDEHGGLTSIGIAVGTPAYMAPEQASADPGTDHRADIYALGVVAYEMLTGRPPFAGRSAQAMIAAHIIETPEPVERVRLSVPSTLGALVMRCLRKDPADRPQSADDILHSLDAIPAAAPANADDRPSLVVLPLVNLSGDPDNEHFSDGLTDELIGALGQLSELAVCGRTSAFALKGKGLDVPTIAATLGVANVLEGSVRRSGQRLKVRVQLVNAVGRVLWSEMYDRTMTDVFDVQEGIAQSVVHALEIRFNTARALVRPPTEDMVAYDLYLRGLFAMRRLGPGDVETGILYYEQAIERDPAYAKVHAALGDAHALLAVFGGRPGVEVLPVARSYAARALELDPNLADAHWARSHVGWSIEFDRGAARGFDRAIALDPGHVGSRHMRSIFLMFEQRFDEAEAELKRVIAADPLLPVGHMTLGQTYLYSGRLSRAVPSLMTALQLSPDHGYAREQLVHAYVALGRVDDAVVEARRAAALGGTRDSMVLAYALACGGQTDEAAAIVQRLTATTAVYLHRRCSLTQGIGPLARIA